MKNFKDFLIEDSKGHFEVSAIVPGPNGTIRYRGVVSLPKDSNRRRVLSRFISRYVERNKIGLWVTQNEERGTGTVKWIEPSKELSISNEPIDWSDFPVMRPYNHPRNIPHK